MKDCTFEQKLSILNTAWGEEKADAVVVGGTLINVYTLELYPADVAIRHGRIAYVGDVSHTIGPNTKKIDASGKYLAPGLIDGHLHIAGTHMSMTEFGKVALMHGGTAVATGFFEIGIIKSLKGIRFFLDELKNTGVKPLFVIPLPAFHQNESFENLGTFTEEMAIEALHWEDCYGVNELNLARVAGKNESLLRIVHEAQQLKKVLVGHASGVRGTLLQAGLSFANHVSDHETVSADEANEKARLGISEHLREGSVGQELGKVLADLNGRFELIGDFGYASDEIDPSRVDEMGYMDAKVRKAIESGVSPALAIRAGSLNVAQFFRLEDDIGSIAPGKCADILLLDNLERVHVDSVIVDGEVLVEKGRYCKNLSAPKYPDEFLHSMNLAPLTSEDFRVKAPHEGSVKVRVIGMNGDPLITDALVEEMKARDGLIEADPERDIAKIFTMDRHQRSGRKGIGFVKGFGIQNGAIAESYAPCIENLNIIGSNDEDMRIAANYLIEHNGGFVVVSGGKVLAALELSIAGIVSPAPYEEVVAGMKAVNAAAEEIGCVVDSVFHKMAFMVYPTQFPSYKLSTYGLANVSVKGEEMIDLFP